MTIDELIQQIEETERLIAVYRNANEVIVGTEDQIYSRRGLINRTVLTAAEIGDTIVNILERRLAAMRAERETFGTEDRGTPMRPRGLADSIVCRTVTCGRASSRRVHTASYVSSVHLSYSGYRQQHRRKERASGWPSHHRSTARSDCRALLLLFRE